MDLIKKTIDIKIGNEEFVMAFDMRSIATYKELTNRFFTQGVARLFKEDDEEIIYFIASTLRQKETPNEPLGKEVLEGDILYFLLNLKFTVIELVASALPSSEDNSKKK